MAKKILWGAWIPIAVVVLLVLFVISFFGVLSPDRFLPGGMMASQEIGSRSSYGYDQAIADFAPNVEERKITKAATLTSEVRRGSFDNANAQLHTVIDAADGFVLNENIREMRGSKVGDYSIKIPASSYEPVVGQLKDLGEVVAFTENARDITGQYVSTDVELEVEKERLGRLERLYNERGNLDEKLRLENAIFDQQRKIKYLEEALERLDRDVAYSSISVTLREPESALAGMKFVGFGELVRTFVVSLRSLLYFLVATLPWAVAAGLLWMLFRYLKKFF